MDDEIITSLPIHFSNRRSPNIHIQQFPLLTRPLQAPPSALASGKHITARIKPQIRRLEIHVPADSRSDVWNVERAKGLGAAQAEDDRERNQGLGDENEGHEPRLSEVRMRSEEVHQRGVYMLGIVREGLLHLHPISQTHQLRPTLTYLDVQTRKQKRSRGGDDSESDDGPPPDPDDPAPVSVIKKEKKPAGEMREVQLTARKVDDKGAGPIQGGISAVRREMLQAIRVEEDESWEDLKFCDTLTVESEEALEGVFSQSDEGLECGTDITTFLY